MSDADDGVALDPCGCCEGAPADPVVRNAPALPVLSYRVGTHPSFLARMLRRVPLVFDEPAGSARPLQRLTTRAADDPTIAFLDACAVVADILTFYQERIANEGYLRTATERRSVLELARAIGYELGPGVAASVHLAFTVEDAPGSPPESLVRKGTQVQSVPPQGKLPQVFETSNDFTARQEWNLLRPRLTRPSQLALIQVTGEWKLHLLGPAGSFAPGSEGLITGQNPNTLFRLDASDPGSATVDAIPVSRVYLTTASSPIAKGDLLLFAASRGDAERRTLILRVADVVEEVERRANGDEIRRISVDLERLPTGTSPAALGGARTFSYKTPLIGSFAAVSLAPLVFNGNTLSGTIAAKAWRETDLHALLGIQRWHRLAVMKALNTPRSTEPLAPEAGAFAFRETTGFFGNTAPRWSSLPSEKTKGNPYKEPWDAGDVTSNSPSTTRSIWTDSQGDPIPDGWDALLERPVKGLSARMWTVFEVRGKAHAYIVEDARETSRADFGVSGRTTGLLLRDEDDTALTSSDKPDEFTFRGATARVGSRRLEFAELPIAASIAAGSKEIELNRLVLGLAGGQPVAFTGERDDLRGVNAAEIAILEEVVHAGGRTTLRLVDPLEYSYVRDTVAILANVVHATHGETVTEVLGSGAGSVPNQRFPLKKPPLTYLSAPTTRGVASTLEVRVNRVLWTDMPSLYEADADDEVYTVRIDDDARAEVIFGDGERGARLPSGNANLAATYRSGIGPDGEVEAATLTLLRTIPLGIRSATNPVAAGGAEGPEQLANARTNAPLTVLTFERIVSLADFEDFARTFPGIGKALADPVSIAGRETVFVTVAGATGGPPGGDVLDNLIDAIGKATDLSQRFQGGGFAQRFFTVHARLVVDPRRVAEDVRAGVEAALREAFGFERRDLAQSVTPSEVVARIHEVEGVLGVDLETLAEYTGSAPAPSSTGQPVDPLVARRARWNEAAGIFEPADLLLVNPVGITIEVAEP
jgi:hypothetical protein